MSRQTKRFVFIDRGLGEVISKWAQKAVLQQYRPCLHEQRFCPFTFETVEDCHTMNIPDHNNCPFTLESCPSEDMPIGSVSALTSKKREGRND
jgi:ATP-dependent helicase YprA (DUF1998 family)